MEAIERWLSEPIDDRCAFIAKVQSRRNKLLDFIAIFASNLSDEEFYVSLLVILHWGISSELCLHVSLLMSTGFIVGNMLKNLFAIPRPNSRLVHRARPSDHDDYSWPSTHALQAASLPLWFGWYLAFVWGWASPKFFMIYIPLALVWAGTLSWSRIYLGAHSLQDVVAGWVVGLVLSIGYCFLAVDLETRLLAGEAQRAGQIVAFSVLILLLHPMEVFINTGLSRWSIIISQSGYLTSCDLAGVLVGAAFGVTSAPKNVPISVFERPYAGLFRFTVGPLIAAAVYFTSRKLLRSVLLLGCNAVGLPVFDPPAKQAQIPPTLTLKKEGDRVSFESLNVHTFRDGTSPLHQRLTQSHLGLLLLGSGFQVMPIAKFLQYGALSWTVCAGAPIFFQALGL